jgi:hypothetical protein
MTAVSEETDLRKQFEEVKQRATAGLMIYESAVELTKPLTIDNFEHHIKRMKTAIESYLSASEKSQ